jgi:hypothetical protein
MKHRRGVVMEKYLRDLFLIFFGVVLGALIVLIYVFLAVEGVAKVGC